MNIYLIGYRCTGKTTVGRLLSEKLGWNFSDTDAQIAQSEGRSPSRIVKEEGWERFRQIEGAVLESLSRREDTVVATGSGVVLLPANRDRMRASGRAVWLKASEASILSRMAEAASPGASKPAGVPERLRAAVAKNLAVLNPLYQGAADLEIDATDLAPGAVVGRIMGHLL